ncbi:NADPH-adrenodoxin reductase [Rhizina undulata]
MNAARIISRRTFLLRRTPVPQYRRCRPFHTSPRQPDRPLRLAVIGAGPAGFYTAYRLLGKVPNAHVDMYESLPVPYGLVRFGVAPDHPEVKNCQEKFEEVALSNRFTYIGNIPIGTSWPHPPHKSLPLNCISPHYDAMLFSYGASKDRQLGVPGETSLKGVYSARAFVGWYNGLPEYRDLDPDLEFGEEAVVIGQGNVALDVARVLLMDVGELKKTDITEYALEKLATRSRIKRVRVVGRRGPMQAAFTVKELRELLSLPSVGFPPVDPSLLPPADMVAALPRAPKRILQVLQKGPKTPNEYATKSWELSFLRSPTSFLPSTGDRSHLGAIEFAKTRLEDPYSASSGVVTTEELEVLPAAVAFRSIGYLSEPIPGFDELGITFNTKRGLIPNEDGRVVRPLTGGGDLAVRIPGIYASGWVKRGPTGVIASTMYDAFDTADAIAEDWIGGVKFLAEGGMEKRGWEAVRDEAKSRGLRPVSWQEWRKIDEAERERGRRKGKEREKFGTEEEMMAVLE